MRNFLRKKLLVGQIFLSVYIGLISLLSFFLYVYTLLYALNSAGVIALIISICTPIISNIYWMYHITAATGDLTNNYNLANFIFLILILTPSVFYLIYIGVLWWSGKLDHISRTKVLPIKEAKEEYLQDSNKNEADKERIELEDEEIDIKWKKSPLIQEYEKNRKEIPLFIKTNFLKSLWWWLGTILLLAPALYYMISLSIAGDWFYSHIKHFNIGPREADPRLLSSIVLWVVFHLFVDSERPNKKYNELLWALSAELEKERELFFIKERTKISQKEKLKKSKKLEGQNKDS